MVSLLALAVLGARAAQAGEIGGRCSLRFVATSTLHDVEGHAPCAVLAVEPGGAALKARVEVEVAQMTTELSARDARMREMFDSAQHPRIVASFEGVQPEAVRRAARRGGPAQELAFSLRIRDAERKVVPVLSGWQEPSGGAARFRASFELSLSDFGLEAPVAMGWLRVGDRVRVEVDVDVSGLSAA